MACCKANNLEGKERSREADGAVGEVGGGPCHLQHQSAKQDIGDTGAKDGEDDNPNES